MCTICCCLDHTPHGLFRLFFRPGHHCTRAEQKGSIGSSKLVNFVLILMYALLYVLLFSRSLAMRSFLACMRWCSWCLFPLRSDDTFAIPRRAGRQKQKHSRRCQSTTSWSACRAEGQHQGQPKEKVRSRSVQRWYRPRRGCAPVPHLVSTARFCGGYTSQRNGGWNKTRRQPREW